MTRPLPLAWILTLLALLLSGCDQNAAQKEELRALFANVDNCYNSSDGVGIVDLYTDSTFAYYDSLIPVILDGTPERVADLPPQYQYEVLLARLKGTRAELTGLTGRRYFAHATGRGWYIIPPDQRTNDTLGNFEFPSEDEARAEVYTDGERTGLRLIFRRENGTWKIDEPSSWDASTPAWRQAADEAGTTLGQYLVTSLAADLEVDIPESIWGPMAP